MSGIYIPGMEMPKSCAFCPMFDDVYTRICDDDEYVCKLGVNLNYWQYAGDEPKDCPLIEVPDHGGLVDANRLIEIALHLMHTAKNDDIANGVKWLWQYILEAPTIIQADKEGKEKYA